MKKTIIIALFIFVSGCSVWDNFTTFFNTFYNAQRDFEEVEDILKADKEYDRFKFKQENLPGKSKTLLNNIIRNLSDILQYHPNSDYVDESLLMLGKVFYLDSKFPKAERKFEELAGKPESELFIENLIWLGKAQLQQRKFEKGLATLQLAKKKASETENNELFEEAFIAEISFYLFRKEYEMAITNAKTLFNFTEDEEMKSRLAFEIGKLFKLQGNKKEAILWFSKVLEFEPDFDTEFRSRLETAVINRELAKYDESLTEIKELEEEDKFNNFQDEIQIELGKTYFELGDLNNAVYNFFQVDSLFQAKPSAGEARFMLGNIMDKIYHDYDSAYVFYNSVAKSKADEKIKSESRKRINTLSSYFNESKNQYKYERQYKYLVKPEIFTQDSLAYEEYLLTKKTEEQKDSLAQKEAGDDLENRNQENSRNNYSNSETGNKDDLNKNMSVQDRIAAQKLKEVQDLKSIKKPVRPTLTMDSLATILSESFLIKGNLFFSELNVPDSAWYYYNVIINDFDSTIYDANAYYNIGSYYSSVGDSVKADSLFNFVYARYPDSQFAEAAAIKLGLLVVKKKDDPAEDEYLEAEKEIENQNFSQAIEKLEEIISKYPTSVISAKSLYTKGWIYENILFEPDSAISSYRKLIENFRRTEYSREITAKVRNFDKELKEIELRKKAIQDSIRNVFVQDSLKTIVKRDSIKKSLLKDSIKVIAKPDSI